MKFRFNGTPERLAAIEAVLPKVPITEELIPILLKLCKKPLLEALKKEIEIYKAFPKAGRMDKITFDTTNHKTCFMGQGFRVSNSEFDDADLSDYRKAVGTFRHGTWGNATLLEIWGGDHFKEHKSMVKAVFSYCRGERTKLPSLQFYIFPLFSNPKSGRWTLDADDRAAFLTRYLIELNGQLSLYAGPKMKPKYLYNLEKKEDLEEFERSWQRYKNSASPLFM